MNIWLVTFQVEKDGVEYEHHLLLRGADLPVAQAACEFMGETWWRGARPICSQGCYWTYLYGSVWLSAITLLGDAEAQTLSGLKFLEAWCVTGTATALTVRDEQDNQWEDFRD